MFWPTAECSTKGFLIMERGSLKSGSCFDRSSVFVQTFVQTWRPSDELKSWNTEIARYVNQRKYQDALDSFEQMQNKGISANALTFSYILKACGRIRAVDKGRKVHEEIVIRGFLPKNVVIGNALVDMYVKFGVLSKAHQVHDEIYVRDVVSWSAIIAGHTKCGQAHEALNCFEQMHNEGISANSITFACILKACGSLGAIDKGEIIHNEISKRDLLGKDVVLATALVDMYVKCGVLTKAQKVHDELHTRDVISWNTLIAGYTHQGEGHQALNCFKQMQGEGVSPNTITFLHILKACADAKAVEMGRHIQDEITRKGLLEKESVLGTALVVMYAKCGLLRKAKQLHDVLHTQNVVSWNALIAGYVEAGQGYEAMNCFTMMQRKGILPDAVTFASILKACVSTGDIGKGKEIHDEIVSQGLLEKDFVLGTALVDMYAKCGMLTKAQQVHDELFIRDIVSWNALIAGLVQHKQDHEAFNSFEQMRKQGFSPNLVTYICILKACGNMGDFEKGKHIHDEIASRGMLVNNAMLGNAIVDMYAKCGMLLKSQEVLEELPIRSVISWSALIAGYVQHGRCAEALNCFQQMLNEGISPDVVTYSCILNACGNTGAVHVGRLVHEQIVKEGVLNENIVLGTALVDMYAKCGFLTKAQEVLEALPVRNVVCWSALISGYAQQENAQDALGCFEQMLKEGHSPDEMTLTCMLKVCGCIGAADKGEQIHDEILARNLLQRDIVLGTALVDMYIRCGLLERAQQVLEELPDRDVVTWNVLISGYAQQGQGHKALQCFVQMQGEGLSPDAVTLLSVLSVCSGSSLLGHTQTYFGDMSIKPTLEHHICMIAIFGCAGQFDKALSVIKTMPSSNDLSVWLTLLSACRKWANVELGKIAFDQAVRVENTSAAPYVLMLSIYGAAGMHDEAEILKLQLKTKV